LISLLLRVGWGSKVPSVINVNFANTSEAADAD
jgi:hypothetical protein